MTPATHLRSLQALDLALRKGSLKGAADALSVTPAAVGQRIRALEDYLGLDLLVRRRTGIHPTPELQKALEHLFRAFRELEAVTSILDFQRVDEVHVVADTDWETLWLRPRLQDFKRQNPNVLLCINGIGDVPLRLGQEDCRIWFGEIVADQGSEVLFADYLLPVTSQENAARVAKQPKDALLEGFPLLHLNKYAGDPAAIDWPRWVQRHGYRKGPSDRGLRYSRLTHALEAVRSDAGQLLCGVALVLDEVEAGRLSAPFPVEEGGWTQHAYQLGVRRHAARRTAVQQFRAWLMQEGAKTAERLAAFTSRSAAGRKVRRRRSSRQGLRAPAASAGHRRRSPA